MYSAACVDASESESEWSCSCVWGVSAQRKVGVMRSAWAGRIGTEKVFSGRSGPARSISAEVRVKESGKGGVGI